MSQNIIDAMAQGLPVELPNSIGLTAVRARAQTEIERWGTRNEWDPMTQTYLQEYWDTVGLDNWTPSIPWSAAFVSYVMEPFGLPPNSAHWRYVEAVIDGKASGWYAYRLQGPVHLEIGDILVRPRGIGTPKDDEYYYSHGDIVYEICPQVRWVGGNLSDRLKTGQLTTADGLSDVSDYTILLRRPKKNMVPILLVGLLGIGLLIAKGAQK